jgi:hypothetical protein
MINLVLFIWEEAVLSPSNLSMSEPNNIVIISAMKIVVSISPYFRALLLSGK